MRFLSHSYMLSATIHLKTFQLLRRLLFNRTSCNYIKMTTKSSTVNQAFFPKPDLYNGLTIETQDLSLSDEDFEGTLSSSLNEWITKGIRGVWFKVHLSNSSYIPILVKHGFLFHHAKTTFVMLTRWLPGDEPNLLPNYPYTHIGVGGMVINEKNEVLTIQEKFHTRPHWKFPGGYSNPGEDFADTARREVFEETGIETEFVSVVSLRHQHQHLFNCSDIYVVCHLKPVSKEITKSKDEIALCEWMPIEKFKNHPQVTDFNRYIMNAFLESQRINASMQVTQVLSYKKDCHHKVYTVKNIHDSK